MNAIVKSLLHKIAGILDAPAGAYSFRVDGKSDSMRSSENIEIRVKTDKSGIDIHVKPGTKNETVHIPALIGKSGHVEAVYNDFHIGEGAEVLVVAGCGIHNDGDARTQHDGIHAFHLEKNARVTYVEKHYGEGGGTGENVLNPITEVYLGEGSYLEMDTVQIEGVDSTRRVTRGKVGPHATLIVKEKLMTSGAQVAETLFEVDLDGEGASANIVSRSVAKGESKQVFLSRIDGNNACMGHSECDAIIMDNASVKAVPEITANHVDASLIHEAAIGKIAGEQIVKLMTLGLGQEEAEAQIVNGFLK